MIPKKIDGIIIILIKICISLVIWTKQDLNPHLVGILADIARLYQLSYSSKIRPCAVRPDFYFTFLRSFIISFSINSRFFFNSASLLSISFLFTNILCCDLRLEPDRAIDILIKAYTSLRGEGCCSSCLTFYKTSIALSSSFVILYLRRK